MTTNLNQITPEIVDELKKILGDRNVITDKEKLEDYKTDAVVNPIYHHLPDVVVFPGSTEEVSDVIKLANKYLIHVTPRGAGTGLVCGAIPIYGGIVLSLDHMNKIIEFNEKDMYVVAEAGVLTDTIQKEAKRNGLLYAGDPCSSDSCQIGGNVATNAGGNRAVLYGTTKDQVWGIEVVTPTGEIINLGGRLKKKTTGYNLEQVIMGAEGTLGIITKVTLKLVPLPPNRLDLLYIYKDIAAAAAVVNKIIKAGVVPTSMEFMDNNSLSIIGPYLKIDLPYAKDGFHYLIVTLETFHEEDIEKQAAIMEEIGTESDAVELLVADEEHIWKARRNLAEAVRAYGQGAYFTEDIVVPVDKIPNVMAKVREIEKKLNVWTVTSGHIGDGNLHTIVFKGDINQEEWDQVLRKWHMGLYGYVKELGGKMSGEHGIGTRKRVYFKEYCDSNEMKLSRSLKQAWDPNGILNRDKIFFYNESI